MAKQAALKIYQHNNNVANIMDASPHRVVQVLLENALDRLNKSKLAIKNENIHDKGMYISMAITIIDGLKASLDLKNGGEIASNLNNLYDYMMTTLVTANLNTNLGQVEEVQNLLLEIKKGWDQIPEEYHHKVDKNES